MAQDPHPHLRLTTGETAIVFTAANDLLAFFTIPNPMTVYEIGIIMTVVGTGSLVVDFDRRITPGTDTGRIDKGLGTVSKAAASLAVGKVLSKQVSARLETGDQVVIQCTTALTGTGQGIPYILGYAAGAGTAEPDTVISD